MSQKYFVLITIGITLSFDHRMIFWTIHSNHNQHTQPHTGLTLRRPGRPLELHTFRQCTGHRRMNALTVQEANGNVGQVNAFHSRHTVTGDRIAGTIPMKESAVSLSHITHLLSMFTHILCSPVCHIITIHTYFDWIICTSDVQGSSCSSDMFWCENGPCIQRSLRCNGITDCPYDNSDELDCQLAVCKSTGWPSQHASELPTLTSRRKSLQKNNNNKIITCN